MKLYGSFGYPDAQADTFCSLARVLSTLLFQSPPSADGSATAVEGLEIFVRREDGIDIVPDGSGDKGWWVPAPKPEGVSEGGSILVNGSFFLFAFRRVSLPFPFVPLPPKADPTFSIYRRH